ncbi:MAG: Gldg family protein, partial [Planctomycetes bacterium]|nr:Gldg family protein [Planctomycetota bacterium]
MIRGHILKAVFKRNFAAYFVSPTGYVFITLFIVACAIAAFWQNDFFKNNLANLDQLNWIFPYLLLFFAPTITMSAWADERRQGTDELLLTLPVRDIELVLGKYLAALGIYSVALAFSLSFVLVLAWLGSPDMGVLFGTYLGYWFFGAALIAVGMVGSLLTTSATVAFILGAVFCILPIFVGQAAALFSGPLERWVAGAGAMEPFRDLARGVLPLQAIIYFASLAAVMLYFNLILLARRHIAGGPGSGVAWVHFGVRSAGVLVAAISLTVLAGRYGTRVDLTQERLHSLARETRELIWKVDPSRPVMIHAYISPEVPQTVVETRENLIALLREVAGIGGDRIQLNIVDTEPYSPEAREAQDKFGIKPERITEFEEGRSFSHDVYLGVAMTCGAEDTGIPFVHRGLSVEYELARSLGVVAGARRKKVGIATTDAKLFGGFNFENFSQSPSWQIVEELKKQYDVVEIPLDQPVTEALDALLVVMPSSLTQPQMDNLRAYVKKGGPTLLCDDPLPLFNLSMGPTEPKRAPGGRGGMFSQPPQEQKGNIHQLMSELGVIWPVQDVVWDTFNPYPQYQELEREFVFVGQGSGAAEAFNPNDPIPSGLQILFLPAGGHLTSQNAQIAFTPLLRTTRQSGVLPSGQVIQRGFMGGGWNEARSHYPSGNHYVMAARVKGTIPGPPSKEGETAPSPTTINAVVVADVDMITDWVFDLRKRGMEDLNFDNVTFVLNSVD